MMTNAIGDVIKALSLECLRVQTPIETERNEELFRVLDSLDEEYKSCSCRAEQVSVLARVYEVCICMDVI